MSLVGVAGPGLSRAGAAGSYTAYVGNDQCPTNNSVSEVTGPRWKVRSTIGVGSCPAGIAFTPNGATAYVLNASDSTITPVTTATFTAGTAFSAGVSSPIFIAVTPDGKSIVTEGDASDNVAVISTTNTNNVQTVPVGNGPNGIAILPNGSAAYVANTTDGTVSVVRLNGTPTVTKTITFKAPGCSGFGIAAAPNGKNVYVACGNGDLWKIAVATNKAAASPIVLPQTSGGAEVVITPNGKTAYVSNTNGDVYPVTLKTATVRPPIAVAGAYGLAMSPDGRYVMAGDGDCCFTNTDIFVIKVATNMVTSDVPTGTNYVHRWLAFQP
jgi:DNA-binding beta-propeller fold protein YncE